MVELGLGCIEIGRKWGVIDKKVPEDGEVMDFLDFAYGLGIHFFDTAPAYGLSEQRLGVWLKRLPYEERRMLTVATKMGEYWDFDTQKPFRNYHYDALKRSLDTSMTVLGKVDILQVHGFTREVWENNFETLEKLFSEAKSLGIRQVGVSLSDQLIASIAVDLPIDVIQLPHNILRPNDAEVIREAVEKGKRILINRPFAMGEIVQKQDGFANKVEAFDFIIKDLQEGIILTGTSSQEHLQENLRAFDAAMKRRGKQSNG